MNVKKSNALVTAREWFDSGKRSAYDPVIKEILGEQPTKRSGNLCVFTKVSRMRYTNHWTTILPGFPDGSYGWAQVDQYLSELESANRIYLEYVGQGDSDKPDDYPYGTLERADLVEAQWRFHAISETVVVTFDYSSLVLLELLNRQLERQERGDLTFTRITKVLMINGGYFVDAHTHPPMTTPLLKTRFGRMGTKIAQRSRLMFNLMMKGLWSEEYGVTNEELEEVYQAISRRNGVVFMSNASGFVDEHKANSDRWDLRHIYHSLRDEVEFHIVGSEKDQFEYKQVIKARERLSSYGLDIKMLPGGHMTTSEYPEKLAQLIAQLEFQKESYSQTM